MLQAQVASLRQVATAVDRVNALSEDSQFVFDFLNPPDGLPGIVAGAGGHTVEASSANFPAVIGNGVAMTVGFLGACAINSPHTHPRATEVNFSANGTLRTGLLAENGARFIMNDLPPGSMTVFPQGAIHFEMNDGCDPAMFVAAFNGEDPGVVQLAQRFLGLPVDIVSATLGDIGVEEVEGLAHLIPDNIVLGTECLKRCGLDRPATQPKQQQQTRVAANAFPTGS
ncbi:RmlC-like cupin [Mycena amicta]|nr:RmlC-like cupin [Mycena amicta]